MMMQWLIAWLNECSWRLLSTIAQPWTVPVSVLGPSWPTFSLFLPVQSSLFPSLLWAELFTAPSMQNAKGVSIISGWLLYRSDHSHPSECMDFVIAGNDYEGRLNFRLNAADLKDQDGRTQQCFMETVGHRNTRADLDGGPCEFGELDWGQLIGQVKRMEQSMKSAAKLGRI